jgi:hypothetical protein
VDRHPSPGDVRHRHRQHLGAHSLPRGSRPFAPWLAVVAILLGVLVPGCTGIDFPTQVVAPVQVGVISDVEDVPGFDVAVFGAHRVEFSTDEPHPGLGIGHLMLYWGNADPAFVTFAPRRGADCFGYQPPAAFNEPDAIVMVLRDQDDLGVRLPKAAGYEADPLEYDDETGQFTQPAPDFCVNEAAEVTLGGEVAKMGLPVDPLARDAGI